MLRELSIQHHEINFFTRIDGEGAPLVLLHSYWGSSELFDQLVKELTQQKFQVIRIDFPGHGKSSSPLQPYTFAGLSESIDHILQQLGIDEPIPMIGHSMGGYLAMAFTKKYPHRVKALALMHSPLCSADQHSKKLREREADFLRKGKKELLLRTLLPTNFAPGNEAIFSEAFELLNRISRQVSTDGALAAIHAINHRDDFRQFEPFSRLPLLLIIGEADRVYDAAMMKEEAAQFPSAKTLSLCSSGHLGFLEEADKVSAALTQFLH